MGPSSNMIFKTTSGAMKPVSSMRNSLGDFEVAARDSEIGRFSDEVVGKLGEIASVMRDGNQAVRNTPRDVAL